MNFIKVSELESRAGLTKNRIRTKVSRDERYQYSNGSLPVNEALKALKYVRSKDGETPELALAIEWVTGMLTGNRNSVTDEKSVTNGVTDVNANGNGNRKWVTKKKSVTDGNVTDEYIDAEDVTTEPKVITFLRGSYWKGVTALLAVTVSSVYLALFINNTAHAANLPIHPFIGYMEAVIFSVIGVTLAASNKEKKIYIGGDKVSVGNLWLFVFFSIEVAAMLSAWGIITSPVFCMTVLALMPPVTLLSYAHLFVSK